MKAKIIFRIPMETKRLFEKMYQFVKSIALKNKLKLINSQSQKGSNFRYWSRSW